MRLLLLVVCAITLVAAYPSRQGPFNRDSPRDSRFQGRYNNWNRRNDYYDSEHPSDRDRHRSERHNWFVDMVLNSTSFPNDVRTAVGAEMRRVSDFECNRSVVCHDMMRQRYHGDSEEESDEGNDRLDGGGRWWSFFQRNRDSRPGNQQGSRPDGFQPGNYNRYNDRRFGGESRRNDGDFDSDRRDQRGDRYSQFGNNHRYNDRRSGEESRRNNGDDYRYRWERQGGRDSGENDRRYDNRLYQDGESNNYRSNRPYDDNDNEGYHGRRQGDPQGEYRGYNGYRGDHHRSRNCSRGDLEQPSYEIQCSPGSLYEVRRYTNATWVVTNVNTSSIDAAKIAGYKRQKYYKMGCNDQGVRMNKTRPMQIFVSNVNASDGQSFLRPDELYSVAMYLPQDMQANPPVPSDSILTLQTKELYVFAWNFTGYPYGLTAYTEYLKLKRYLDEDGNSDNYQPGEFILNQFTSPFDKDGGQNEILIPVKPGADVNPCNIPNGIRQCGRAECPGYKTIQTLQTEPEILLRETKGGVYATYSEESCDLGEAFGSYPILDGYFNGLNTKEITMERTTPIIQYARQPSPEFDCDFTYRLSFYLPKKFHQNPPVPIEKTVLVKSRDTKQYYVMVVENDGSENLNLEQNYQELKQFLDANNLCYDADQFDMSRRQRGRRSKSYDAPFRAPPRRFEIAVPAQDCL